MAYVSAANGFQRSLLGTPLQSELNGGNVSGNFRPSTYSSFAFGHQNYMMPQSGTQTALHTQVDNLAGNWRLWDTGGPSIGAAVFRSTMPSITTRGASLWISQSLSMVDMRLKYLVSGSNLYATSQSLSITTQEKLSARLSALQVTSLEAGKVSMAFGGNLIGNLLSLGVNYQTLYVPVRPSHPFTQALALSLKMNLHGNLHLNTDTSFSSTGQMVYTLAGSESYYRLNGLDAAPQTEGFRLQQYVLQGQITTADGLPVYGAALRIGKEMIYTDRDGRFAARESKAGPYKIEILTAEFLESGAYTVITAPSEGLASKDESTAGIHIIVGRS